MDTSSNGFPINCNPMGNPFEVHPHGSDMAHRPRKFTSRVVNRAGAEPTSAMRGGGVSMVGHTTASTSLNVATADCRMAAHCCNAAA